jgi:hypothetical protein
MGNGLSSGGLLPFSKIKNRDFPVHQKRLNRIGIEIFSKKFGVVFIFYKSFKKLSLIMLISP